MPLRPWLLYYRLRLIIAALLSLLAALAVLFATSSDKLSLGVLWHQSCTCPVDSSDLAGLFAVFTFLAVTIGWILAFNNGATAATAGRGDTLFFLTRPISRAAALLAPIGLAILAMVLFPLLATLLLLGWLELVHAPSLGHLVAIMEQIPAASHLGPHPSLVSVLLAVDFPRRMAGALSIGLCVYAIIAAQRWLMLSSNNWIKFLGSLAPVVPFLGIFGLGRIFGHSHNLVSILFLVPTHLTALAYLPSGLGIALHLIFTMALIYGFWRVLHRAEL